MTYIADTFNDQSVAPLGIFKAALQGGRAAMATRLADARPAHGRLLREIDGVTRRDFGLFQQVAEELRGCGFEDAALKLYDFDLPTTAYGTITRWAALQFENPLKRHTRPYSYGRPFLDSVTFQAFFRLTDGSLIHYEVMKTPSWLNIPTIIYESSREEVLCDVVRQLGQYLQYREETARDLPVPDSEGQP